MSAAPTMKRRRSSIADRRRAYGKASGRARRSSVGVVVFGGAGAARRAPGNAAAAAADEGEEVLDVGRVHFRLDARRREREVDPLAKEEAEGGGERADALAVEARAAEPDAVQAADHAGLVRCDERWHIARSA